MTYFLLWWMLKHHEVEIWNSKNYFHAFPSNSLALRPLLRVLHIFKFKATQKQRKGHYKKKKNFIAQNKNFSGHITYKLQVKKKLTTLISIGVYILNIVIMFLISKELGASPMNAKRYIFLVNWAWSSTIRLLICFQ